MACDGPVPAASNAETNEGSVSRCGSVDARASSKEPPDCSMVEKIGEGASSLRIVIEVSIIIVITCI